MVHAFRTSQALSIREDKRRLEVFDRGRSSSAPTAGDAKVMSTTRIVTSSPSLSVPAAPSGNTDPNAAPSTSDPSGTVKSFATYLPSMWPGPSVSPGPSQMPIKSDHPSRFPSVSPAPTVTPTPTLSHDPSTSPSGSSIPSRSPSRTGTPSRSSPRPSLSTGLDVEPSKSFPPFTGGPFKSAVPSLVPSVSAPLSNSTSPVPSNTSTPTTSAPSSSKPTSTSSSSSGLGVAAIAGIVVGSAIILYAAIYVVSRRYMTSIPAPTQETSVAAAAAAAATTTMEQEADSGSSAISWSVYSA